MRALRPWSRDLSATFLVFVATAYYGLHTAGVHVPEVRGARAVAAVVLFLGIVACAAGADLHLLRPGQRLSMLVRTQSALGVAAFVAGMVAIASGSELMLSVLFAITALLWTSATLRHVARHPTRSRTSAKPTELVRTGR